MARRGAPRNEGGKFEPGLKTIFYDAFHNTGAFEPPRPEEEQERGHRAAICVSLASSSIPALEELGRAWELNRSRVIDRLVREEMKRRKEGEDER